MNEVQSKIPVSVTAAEIEANPRASRGKSVVFDRIKQSAVQIYLDGMPIMSP